jgi:benzoyl-CoA reductase/2-hydroxyglutaryl-CoA dehydratase subunit BcrC/BadD/HgdB
MPGGENGIGSSGSETIGDKRDGRQRSDCGTIKETIEVLATQIWHNLRPPKQVIVPCEFDCDEVMNWCERGRCIG